jgi:hypothetical protein
MTEKKRFKKPGTAGDLHGTGAEAAPRKPYRPPRLEVLGDVRDVTLGTSGGTGESGAPATRFTGISD